MSRQPSFIAWGIAVACVALIAVPQWRNRHIAPSYQRAVARADSAAAAIATQQHRVNIRQQETDRITTTAIALRQQAMVRLSVQRAQRDTLALVAHDTTASSDTLRAALVVAITALDSVASVADGLMLTLDSVTAAHARERAAWQSLVAGVDTALAAERALRTQTECRVWRFPCPSRRQSAVLAALATLVLTR